MMKGEKTYWNGESSFAKIPGRGLESDDFRMSGCRDAGWGGLVGSKI